MEHVTVHMHRAVAVISFKSALEGTITNKGAALLHSQISQSLGDASVRAIILTGAEQGVFIRHANLAQIAKASEAVLAGQIGADDFLNSPFQQLGRLLDEAEKPVIAAINGTCMGGGLEIALACTMRIASSAVDQIGLPEIRLDIPPGAGGPQRLARLIGPHKARLFALQGRVVAAAEASDIGIVDAVAEDALESALAQASIFAQRAPPVVAALLEQLRVADAPAIEANARLFAACLDQEALATKLRRAAQTEGGIGRLP